MAFLLTRLGASVQRFSPAILNRSYKSALALETLYPTNAANLQITAVTRESSTNKFTGYIPINQLNITYSKSSGPGGQNVNKVNTKVDLRFHLESANWINNDVKSKLLQKYKVQLTKDGYLVFKSDSTRSQQLNLADCLSKLRQAIFKVMYVAQTPSTESIEKARKRHEKAVHARLLEKRNKSMVKAARRGDEI